MSSSISTQDGQSLRALDRADVSITVRRVFGTSGSSKTIPGTEPIGIAKSLTFNINKPKTPIQVLTRLNPAGFARDPEDRTFQMTALQTFERMEQLAYFLSSSDPFEIRIVHSDKTDSLGNPAADAKQKVMTLKGVEFESGSYEIGADTSQYTYNFSGRFTGGSITGDVSGDWDPVTGEDVNGGITEATF